MSKGATDSRGYLEVVQVAHENCFNTFASYASTAPSAQVLLSTLAGKAFRITQITVNSATTTNYTFLENTATTKYTYNGAAGGGSIPLRFDDSSPLMIATGAALHITTAGTSASVFVSGYYV